MLVSCGDNKNLVVAKGFLMTREEFEILVSTLKEKTNLKKDVVFEILIQKYVTFLDETGYDVTFDIPNILVHSKMFYIEDYYIEIENENVELITIDDLKLHLKELPKMKKENEIDIILKDTIKELIINKKINYWASAEVPYGIEKNMRKKDIKQHIFVANQKTIYGIERRDIL